MSEPTREFEVREDEILFDEAALADLLADDPHPAHAFTRFPRRLSAEKRQGNTWGPCAAGTVRVVSWNEEGLGGVPPVARLNVPSGRLLAARAAHPSTQKSDSPTREVTEIPPGTYFVWPSGTDGDAIRIGRVDPADDPMADGQWATGMARILERCPACREAVSPVAGACPKCKKSPPREKWVKATRESPVSPEEVNGGRCRRCGEVVAIRTGAGTRPMWWILVPYFLVPIILQAAGFDERDSEATGLLILAGILIAAPLIWVHFRRGGRRYARAFLVICDECGLVSVNGRARDDEGRRFRRARDAVESLLRTYTFAFLGLGGMCLAIWAGGATPSPSILLCTGALLFACLISLGLRGDFGPATEPWWRRILPW